MSEALCLDCGCRTRYTIKTQKAEAKVRGARFEYDETLAYCTECGAEVYVPEINDKNVEAMEKACFLARPREHHEFFRGGKQPCQLKGQFSS